MGCRRCRRCRRWWCGRGNNNYICSGLVRTRGRCRPLQCNCHCPPPESRQGLASLYPTLGTVITMSTINTVYSLHSHRLLALIYTNKYRWDIFYSSYAIKLYSYRRHLWSKQSDSDFSVSLSQCFRLLMNVTCKSLLFGISEWQISDFSI